jgi:3-isopropylmalate/(R)-2-methylmalate dehydratase large subunit
MRTIVEKIFSAKLGRSVSSGEIVVIEVDGNMMHDINGPIAIKYFDALKASVKSPQKNLIVLDHLTPCPTTGAANSHKLLREFAKRHGIDLIEEGQGVCHQAMMELGKARPGSVVVGTDSHCSHYGALNCFSTGIGASEQAIILASDQCWFRVPKTIRVNFHGVPKPHVTTKDLSLAMIDKLTASGAIYHCLEFGGDTLHYFSVEGRSVICNMAIEVGAKGAIMPCDETLLSWFRERGIVEIQGIEADAGAVYEKIVDIDVSSLKPLVAVPPEIDRILPVEQMEEVHLNQVVIGSCTNGNYEDFVVAASILQGKRIHEGIRLLIVPALASTAEVMEREGIYRILLHAGAVILPPSCGPCAGLHGGLIAEGENVFSTTNRNLPGRMGSAKGNIYIGSPVVAAYSALAGKICVRDMS